MDDTKRQSKAEAAFIQQEIKTHGNYDSDRIYAATNIIRKRVEDYNNMYPTRRQFLNSYTAAVLRKACKEAGLDYFGVNKEQLISNILIFEMPPTQIAMPRKKLNND